MRAFALVIAACAAACVGAALWLLVITARWYFSADYAPHAAGMPGYMAGGVQADGDGIFAPAILLLAVGIFLGRFAFNLWRKP